MSESDRIEQLESEVAELKRRCLSIEVRADAEAMQSNVNFRGLFQDLAIVRRGHDESVKTLSGAINSHAKSIDGHASAIGAYHDSLANVSTLAHVLKRFIVERQIATEREIEIAFNQAISEFDRKITEMTESEK